MAVVRTPSWRGRQGLNDSILPLQSRRHGFAPLVMMYSVLLLQISVAVMDGVAPNDEQHKTKNQSHIRQTPLPILDMLFPSKSIDRAYEVHPLLATAYPSDNNKKTENTIPMVPVGNSVERLNRMQSLIPLNSIHSILSHENMVHGTDFKIAKKIEKDGIEWMGIMPGTTEVTANVAIHEVSHNGFSLIIDAMQRRWTAIFRFARHLHDEVQCHLVSCNLYLTPNSLGCSQCDDDGRRSGLESHWDFMDVIVVQIYGEKMWSVASEPIVYLSNQDQKRKPTLEELERFRNSRYNDVLLRPGDALYIPRGFIHNASTIIVDESGDRTPSLHLTFGLEHVCETTFEALVHHAIHDFISEGRGDARAISRKECPQAPHDITWGTVLQQSLSEVARRDDCDSTALFENGGSHPCAGLLRQSVPLHPAFQEIFSSTYTELQHEIVDGDVVAAAFRDALDLFIQNANVTRLVGFMNQLFVSQPLQTTFCYPFINDASVILCPDRLTMKRNVDLFQRYLHEFQQFALARVDSVLQGFRTYTANASKEIWVKNDDALRTVGQEVPVDDDSLLEL